MRNEYGPVRMGAGYAGAPPSGPCEWLHLPEMIERLGVRYGSAAGFSLQPGQGCPGSSPLEAS